jgi:hypothetical protein
MRINQKFKHNNKTFEIIDIIFGASNKYTGTLIFYKNVNSGDVKVKTEKEFLAKFGEL